MANIVWGWRNKQQRLSLRAEVCENCHNVIFPPRDVCPRCADGFQSEIKAHAKSIAQLPDEMFLGDGEGGAQSVGGIREHLVSIGYGKEARG